MDDSKAKLVELIKAFPVLWQPTHKAYGKRGPRDAALKIWPQSFVKKVMMYVNFLKHIFKLNALFFLRFMQIKHSKIAETYSTKIACENGRPV